MQEPDQKAVRISPVFLFLLRSSVPQIAASAPLIPSQRRFAL